MTDFKPTSQQKALLSTEESALVIAGPGTGKTRTAIEKARFHIPLLKSESHKVLFLSFSNAAVFRLAEGIKTNLRKIERKRIAFRTYHAFAADILRSYGRFVGIPPVFKIMDSLEEKLLLIEENVTQSEAAYTEFLNQKAKHGLLGFDKLIPLATKLLQYSIELRKLYARNYPLIIVDEFQDTSPEQWEILKSFGEHSKVITFGDPNQIIYAGMHAATKERLKEFQEWKNVKPMYFSERQFRFGSPEILVFAEAMLKGTKYTPKENSGVYLWDLEFRTKDKDRLRKMLALIWLDIRKNASDKETIAFFAFSNALAEEVAVALRNPPPSAKISFPVYVRLARDEAAYDAVLLSLAALRDYSFSRNEITCKKAAVALMAMNATWYNRATMSIKNLNLISEHLKKSLDNGGKLGKCILDLMKSSDLGVNVPCFVEALTEIEGFKSCCKRISAHGKLEFASYPSQETGLPLFDLVRSARTPKGLEGYDAGRGQTHVINYHKTKGREFDHVVMIVDPRAESSKIGLDELRRLYYVCATRAKTLLFVLYYGKEKGRVLNKVL